MSNVIHGGVQAEELRRLGIDPADVIDFSTNVSPIGPPAGVQAAIAAVDLSAYPEPDSATLVAALAEMNGVSPDAIVVGNGSTELIHLIARVFIRRGQHAIALAPTFGEYEAATELAGGKLYSWQAQRERGFRWILKNKPDVLRRVAPPLVFLCNPNNPTGVYLGQDEVRMLASALTGGPLLLDEAYLAFLPPERVWPALDLIADGRVLVVRSLTKEYALAGLRLGYLIAAPAAVAAIRRLQPSWSVNSAAQAAGRAALADTAYLPRMRAAVSAGKRILVEGLGRLGVPVTEGAANFVLARVGDAGSVRLSLLRYGFAVRDCTSFGLPEYLRLSALLPEQCAALIAAWARVLEDQSLSRA